MNGTNYTSKISANSLQQASSSRMRKSLGRSRSKISFKLFASNSVTASSLSSTITGSYSSLLVLTMENSSSDFSFSEFVIFDAACRISRTRLVPESEIFIEDRLKFEEM